MSKTPVPKCMQHSLQKNAHTYIPTPICIRIHMYTNTHAHALHRPHAEALILRPTIYAQICIHIHIHMFINAYIYVYIHTCTYIYVYMSAHMLPYTYIHTHTNCIYARTQARLKRRRGSDCAGRQLLRPSRCPLQSGKGLPFVAGRPIARPRGTTHKRRTTTINSSSSHHHDSAPSRPHPLICTDAEPIHPVHSPPKLPAWLWPSETRSFSCHFGGFPRRCSRWSVQKDGKNGNWCCYQAHSCWWQVLNRFVRLSLSPASLRHVPKKSKNSQRLCVCGRTALLFY